MHKIFAYPNHKKPYLILSDKLKEVDENLFRDILKSKGMQVAVSDAHALNSESSLYKKYNALINRGEIAWLYSKKRRFNNVTIFSLQDNEIFVEKKFVDHTASKKQHRDITFHTIPKSKIAKGTLVKDFLDQLIETNQFAKFEKEFTNFLAEVIRVFSNEDNSIKSNAIEALARNCSIDEERSYKFFDLEYSTSKNISKELLIFRICFIDFSAQQKVLDQKFGGNFIKYFLDKMECNSGDSVLLDGLKFEDEIQKAVCLKTPPSSNIKRLIAAFITKPLSSVRRKTTFRNKQ